MSTEPSLKFFDTKTESESAHPGNVSPESPSGVNEKSIELARILLVVFGIFFVIIVPVGMLSEEKGILTKDQTVSVEQSIVSVPTDPRSNPSYPSNTPYIQPTKPRELPSSPRANSNSEAQNMRVLVRETSEMVRMGAFMCRQNGGIVQSGSGGQSLCEGGTANIVWPTLSICGAMPGDTTWTVFRGDTDTWDITISCASRAECNGPENALCTKDGYTFSDTCLPKE